MNTPDQIDDTTAEALLAGRAVGDKLSPLVWAVRAYRDVAHTPAPPPSGVLAARMAAGVFDPVADPNRPAVETANRRGLLAAAIRNWRRVRMAVISGLATAAAKLAGLSTAAKAGAGLSIALASLGTAGTAGVLPDPAQDRFDTVVEQITGDQTPPPASENDQFGERVSEDAKDGGVDGTEISEEARQQGEQHRPTQLPDQAPGKAGKPSQLPTPDDPAGHRPTSPPSAPIERPSPTPPAPSQP